MKIAIINNLYEPFERGGAEQIAKMQRQALLDLGHSVIVISTKEKKSDIENKDGLFYITSSFANLNKMSKPISLFWHIIDLFSLSKTNQILDILDEENVDIVVAHNLTGLGKKSAKILSRKYKYIQILHDINLLHPSGLMYQGGEGIVSSFHARLYQFLLIPYFKDVSVVVSPSKWLLDMHINNGFFKNINKEVLCNPIERIVKKEKVDDNKINFLFVGQIEKHKGINVLLEAWSEIECDNCTLIIAGSGSDQDMISKLKNTENINFLGRLDRQELEELYAKSDCLIMPSICYENSPTVIYEAAAQGVFVLSSDIGGAKELTNFFAGSLFETGNANALKEKIDWITTNIIDIRKRGKKSQDIASRLLLREYKNKIKNIIEH